MISLNVCSVDADCGIPNPPQLPDQRCDARRIPFSELPGVRAPYFDRISRVLPSSVRYLNRAQTVFEVPGRPLLGSLRLRRNGQINRPTATEPLCSKGNLTAQVQTALQLEWSTIPTYLTAYYTAVNTSNNSAVLSSFMTIYENEMLHMMLAGNLLIALDASPLIDSDSTAPSFPTCGLAGGVLPGLPVVLRNMSIEQIFYVFMGIEVPQNTTVAGDIDLGNTLTIGAFYQEIVDCINELESRGEEIFNASSANRQVQVFGAQPIVNYTTARQAVEVIVSQGEGKDTVDPYDNTGDSLAHFFRFEEVVCGRELVEVGDDQYAYVGSNNITLNSTGIIPILPNFNSSLLTPQSQCYNEARAFHNTYRTLLTQLQESFNGNPDEIHTAIGTMRSLSQLAGPLISVPFNATYNCGLVWEYEWLGG